MEKDICAFGIKERFERDNMVGPFDSNKYMTKEEAEIIGEILKPLAGYGIKDALDILDNAKTVLTECTQVHGKYRP